MEEFIKLLATIGPTAGAVVAVLYFYLAKRSEAQSNGRDYQSMLQFMQHMQTRIAALEDQLRVYMLYSARLMAQIVGLGGTPVDIRDVEREQRGFVSALAQNDKRMVEIVEQGFDVAEISALAYDLQIAEGSLGDGNISTRAQKLVTWCRRHGRSDELAKLLIRMRPNLAV